MRTTLGPILNAGKPPSLPPPPREPGQLPDFYIETPADALRMLSELHAHRLVFGYARARVTYAPGCEYIREAVHKVTKTENSGPFLSPCIVERTPSEAVSP